MPHKKYVRVRVQDDLIRDAIQNGDGDAEVTYVPVGTPRVLGDGETRVVLTADASGEPELMIIRKLRTS